MIWERHATLDRFASVFFADVARTLFVVNILLGFVLVVYVVFQQPVHAIVVPRSLGGHARRIVCNFPAADLAGGARLELQSDVDEVERQEKPPRHLFARSELHRSVVLELGVFPRAACFIFMNIDDQGNLT